MLITNNLTGITSIGILKQLLSGDAKQFAIERDRQIETLKNAGSNADIIVNELTVWPSTIDVLKDYELTTNPDEWINTVVAEYYGVNSVRVKN